MADDEKHSGQEALTPLQIDLARRILEFIRDNGWKPGTRISVPDLARRFGVSRSPVTVALQILSRQGVVGPVPAPGRGLQVTADAEDVDIEAVAPDSPLEETYRLMIRDRARGTLPQDVSEAELIARYGIARGLVRKLLLRFSTEGLAHRQPGHGWRFSDSLDDETALSDSYEFRMAVECAALRGRNFALDDRQLEGLRHMHTRILSAGVVPDAEEWLRVNNAFHEGLAVFSRNRFFIEAVRQQNNLRRMQESAIYSELSFERIAQSCREHLQILDALAVGEREWAEALLRQHLRRAAEF